jgi:hypothetical protein
MTAITLLLGLVDLDYDAPLGILIPCTLPLLLSLGLSLLREQIAQ